MRYHLDKSPVILGNHPANTTHCNNVGLMLGQRRRRWSNFKPTLFQIVVFAEQVTRSAILTCVHACRPT